MRFQLISVGRERADAAAPLVDDYLGRIRKFFAIEDVILKPERGDKVAERVLAAAAKADLLVALDERGEQMSSLAFASLVSSWMNQGHGTICLVIGGADGLPPAVRERAGRLLALSKMTLPHRLARLLLVEQLYRALCIIRGVPYQK